MLCEGVSKGCFFESIFRRVFLGEYFWESIFVEARIGWVNDRIER